uniref:Uncharacterized protein n=1 Tax=Arundo donax TaxID=35708 RepID=A0A0A8ZY87_ARUDO
MNRPYRWSWDRHNIHKCVPLSTECFRTLLFNIMFFFTANIIH